MNIGYLANAAAAILTVLVLIVVSPAQESARMDSANGAKFSDITNRTGLKFRYLSSHTGKKYLPETMGAGVALFDYDNDGKLDVFLLNGAPIEDPTPKGTIPRKTGPEYWNRLYHQKADGTFEDVTQKAGLQGVGYGMGVAVGDYDNDGFEDLYVTAYGGNRLYHNNGDGTFTDVTEKAGVGGSGWSSSAAWVDLDNDGFLDLVVLRYLQWDFEDIWCGEHRDGFRSYCHPDYFKAAVPLVYHNNGNGTFTEVAQKIGLAKPAKGLGIQIADYDRDGHIDLFFANDSMVEHLYHNKADGTFEEVGLLAGVAADIDGHTYAGMGVDFSDYDNDGWPDIVVTNLANQRYALYHNNGDGTFNYASPATGISRMTMTHSGWGVRLFDFDNDGRKDLLIAQGHDLDTIEKTSPNLRYREPLLLARNMGNEFQDVTASTGAALEEPYVWRGLAIGDLDNDGRLDAVVTANDGPVRVLHNETANANHWILLKLTGHKSNRDAIGASVKISTAEGAQYATVTTAGSYLSSGDKRVHFGLGNASVVESIEIRWPSGIVQSLKNVAADRIVQIEEPTAAADRTGKP